MHNDTDHQIQHPAAVAVELVDPVAVGAAAAGKNRKPWSKDKLGVVVKLLGATSGRKYPVS